MQLCGPMLCNDCQQMPPRHPCLDFSMLSFNRKKPTETLFVYICGTKILGTQPFETTQMCQGSTCHVVAQHGDISKLNKALLLTWEVCATTAIRCHQDIHVWISQCRVSTKNKPTETLFVYICGTKILGTQLFETTQMCQGSTCHVVAQHGDISKLNKALLLTWEVCATIAVKTPKKISQCCSKKHKAKKANQERQHL